MAAPPADLIKDLELIRSEAKRVERSARVLKQVAARTIEAAETRQTEEVTRNEQDRVEEEPRTRDHAP